MARQAKPRQLHSLAEAYLYARIRGCSVCAGRLDAEQVRFAHDADAGILAMTAVCLMCDAPFEERFDTRDVDATEMVMLKDGRLAAPWDSAPPERALGQGGRTDIPKRFLGETERNASILSSTEEPSQVIDVAGWLNVFTIVADEARSATGAAGTAEQKMRARQMRLVAGACLEEALKFFEDDNDLPPDEAFFSDRTRQQFWERPELFTRQYIAELRFSLMRSQ